MGVSQGSADRTVDVSSTVKGQSEALGGPVLLWTVNSQGELSGSPRIHGVSIQYLTQTTKMVEICRDWIWHLCRLCFDELAVCLCVSIWSEVH